MTRPGFTRLEWPVVSKSGFSLVELLVVIGVIGFLIAILLPTLHKAREASRTTQCLSNLRQMAVAAAAYVSENDGRFPIAYFHANEGSRFITYAWDLTTIEENGRVVEVVPGLLWARKGAKKIQQCPSFDGGANWLVDPYTGYNYNTSYIGHGQYESVVVPARVTQIRSPARVALFGDGQWVGGANKFMRAPFPSAGDEGFVGRWAGTQGFRHRKQTNVSFVDGHAETLRERFTDNADGAANVAAGTGFLSRDNTLYGGQ